MTAALSYAGVEKAFGAQRVLRGVDLEVREGTVTFVIGASGAGKSVLGRLAVGLLRPDAGEVRVSGDVVNGLGREGLRRIRETCAMVLQGGTLLDWLSLAENVALPLGKRLGLGRREALSRPEEHLAAVGLGGLAARLPHEVGPGVRKRASIARALALSPRTVIFDEPTTGLDPRAARTVDALIRASAEAGRTALVVSHDLGSILGIADRVALLHEGRIRFEGSPRELSASRAPEVRAFLGVRELA